MGYGFGKLDKASLDKNRLRKAEAKEKGALRSDQQKYVSTVISWCNRQLEINESGLRIDSLKNDFKVLPLLTAFSSFSHDMAFQAPIPKWTQALSVMYPLF